MTECSVCGYLFVDGGITYFIVEAMDGSWKEYRCYPDCVRPPTRKLEI